MDGTHFELNKETLGVCYVQAGKKVFPKTVSQQLHYEREMKDKKVVCEVPVKGEKAPLKLEEEMLNYTYIIAIDTNTRFVNGEKLSVTAMTNCECVREGEGINIRWLCYQGAGYWNMKEPEEKYAWRDMLERLFNDPGTKRDAQILMIVDSDRGNIQPYNMRSVPVVDEWYLPENVTLAYASSDITGDTVYNKLIRLADVRAREVLDDMVPSPNYANLEQLVGKPYERGFMWKDEPERKLVRAKISRGI